MSSPSLPVRPLEDVRTASVEEVFGPTDWLKLTRETLTQFVALINPPNRTVDLTISHNNQLGDSLVDGVLLLSLVPHFFWELWPFRDEGTWALNYGYDRVRFVTPVHVGSRIRMSCRILSSQERADGGLLVKTACTVELDGAQRPAMTADSLMLFLPSSQG
jgi:acyl dehydratase